MARTAHAVLRLSGTVKGIATPTGDARTPFQTGSVPPCPGHAGYGTGIPTHNTSAHRKVFEDVGLFDESLEVCEDVEWSFRCLDEGVGLFYVPGAPVGHFDRNTFRDFWKHYYRFGLHALSVRQKHPRSAYQWLFPKGPLSAVALFLPLTALMTVYVTCKWLRLKPQVLFYLPGLYLANIANYAGLVRSIFKYTTQKPGPGTIPPPPGP